MNNATIIMLESVKLMEAGLIGKTGRQFEVTLADGSKKLLDEPEPIHTFAHWKSLGYAVKKGEHAVAKFPVWKHTAKQKTMVDGNGVEVPYDDKKMFMKVSSWFSMSQVEKMERAAK